MLLACNSSKETDPSEVKKIIDEKNAKLEQWYSQGMIDSAATVFSDDVIQMPPNAQPIKGLENFKKVWKENSQFGRWQFDLNAEEVKVSGDLAVELGSYTLDFSPAANSPVPAMSDKGNYVVLWEKKNGEWKITWDAPVSENPMPMMPAMDSVSTGASQQTP